MTDKMIKRKHYLLFIAGGLSVILFLLLFNKTVQYTSTDEFCNSCHVHPHAEASWRLSPHHNTSSGVSVKCVDCHLPAEDNTELGDGHRDPEERGRHEGDVGQERFHPSPSPGLLKGHRD